MEFQAEAEALRLHTAPSATRGHSPSTCFPSEASRRLPLICAVLGKGSWSHLKVHSLLERSCLPPPSGCCHLVLSTSNELVTPTSVLRAPLPVPFPSIHSGPGALGRAGRRDTVSRGQKTLILKSDGDEEVPVILSLSLASSTALGSDLVHFPQMGRGAMASGAQRPYPLLFTPDPALPHPAQQSR